MQKRTTQPAHRPKDSAKATIITLGCAKNSVDSEHIQATLLSRGIALEDDPAKADYIIINTCGFIQAAKEDSINTILEAADIKKSSDRGPIKPKLIVTGCLAQRYYDDLLREMPEIDILLGIADEFNIADMIANKQLKNVSPGSPVRDFADYPERKLEPLPYAYLQIAEGCDNKCGYCAIPLIRGPYVSKPFEQIIAEAYKLDAGGVRELAIIAQDTGMYGLDLYGKRRLPELIQALDGFNNVAWLRLLYLQPKGVTDELVEAIAGNNFALPYLDIPLQHASERILHSMNRWGNAETYLSLLDKLRRTLPEITLRTTMIVGFPGESDNDFIELCEFIKRARFDYVGIFAYSDEEDTAAANLPNKIPEDVVQNRYHELIRLQDSLSEERNLNKVGKRYDVLIERKFDGEQPLFEGRASWQAPEVDGFCYVRSTDKDPVEGSIVPVVIDEYDGCDFYGRTEIGIS